MGRADAQPISLEELNMLREVAERARKNVIRMLFYDQSIHVGSSLSSIEILTTLIFKYQAADHSPQDRNWLILSKGHAAPALYAVLSEKGIIREDELWKIQSLEGILQGHPEIFIPSVDMSTGSLGQGLSFGLGVAKGMKMSGRKGKVFVIMGDGEQDEGQVWEGFTQKVVKELDNIVVFVELNGYQLDGDVNSIKPKSFLQTVWREAGWTTLTCDGHDFMSILSAIEEAQKAAAPVVIFASTLRGKGFKPIENTKYQRSSPDDARKFLSRREAMG